MIKIKKEVIILLVIGVVIYFSSFFLAKVEASTISFINFVDRSGQNLIKAFWETELEASTYLYYRKKGVGDYLRVGVDDLSLMHGIEFDKLDSGEYEYYFYSETADGDGISSLVSEIAVYQLIDPIGLIDDNKEEVSKNEEVEIVQEETRIIVDEARYEKLKGKIILRVENNGEAYYIHPFKKEMYFLGRPESAFEIMRSQGIGIRNQDINKIPLFLMGYGSDTDGDNVSDYLEDALALDAKAWDSDGDGFSDGSELVSSYDPLQGNGARLPIDEDFAKANKGKIFLQVEKNGEAWYIDTDTSKKVFLGRPLDAFTVMREFGLGVSEKIFSSL